MADEKEEKGRSWLGVLGLLFVGGIVGALGARLVTRVLDGEGGQQALPPAPGYPPPPQYPPPGYYYPPQVPPWYR